MLVQKIKKYLVNIFTNVPMPVFSSQLKGMRLKVSPLMPGNLFFNDVEPQVHNVYNLFIKPGTVFFDVGANVGLHSYYVSRKFNDSSVFAFEPLPANAAYIRSTVKLNNIKNITLTEKAVAEKKGTTYFDLSVNNHQGKITTSNAGIIVKLTSIDIFINETGIKPDFIKIDVEGAESLVMEGFKENISKIKPTIIIEVHDIEQSEKILTFFKPLGYKLCRLLYPFVKNTGKYFQEIILNDEKENIVGQLVAIPNESYDSFTKYLI